MYTLKGNNTGKIVAFTSSKEDSFEYARDYLKAHNHRYVELMNQVQEPKLYEYEIEEIKNKMKDLDEIVTAYDAFNRPCFAYHCDVDGIVRKQKIEGEE